MNIAEIASLVEIVSGIAVVISLVYLSTQIRQSNKLMRLEAQKYAVEQGTAIAQLSLADDSIIDIMLKDRDQLTEKESAKLTILGRLMLNAIHQGWMFRDVANINAEAYRATYQRKADYGMSEAWDTFKLGVEPEFAEWFEQNIAS